jgi:hypothetical protein
MSSRKKFAHTVCSRSRTASVTTMSSRRSNAAIHFQSSADRKPAGIQPAVRLAVRILAVARFCASLYLPWPASVLLLTRATDNNERLTIYSGSETIQERSPVQGGGTAGVTPTEFTTAPVSWIAAGGDRMKLVIDNTTAGTPTVDGVIIVNPL